MLTLHGMVHECSAGELLESYSPALHWCIMPTNKYKALRYQYFTMTRAAERGMDVPWGVGLGTTDARELLITTVTCRGELLAGAALDLNHWCIMTTNVIF